MPSGSEPFGIAPLEAMSYDRPVIVSKQSGVSEVLRNALKVDFWDVDKMASQIVALLELPELRRTIVERPVSARGTGVHDGGRVDRDTLVRNSRPPRTVFHWSRRAGVPV